MLKENEYQRSKKIYSDEWEITSKNYESLGFYDWCIKQIDSCSSIIEIGTGIGICMEKLINENFDVTSIEENPYNFRKALLRLQKAKKNLRIINREITRNNKLDRDNLILGNYITDKTIHDELFSKIDFDGIICWFPGVHSLAHEKEELKALDYKEGDFQIYKDLIYDNIFSITSRYLSNQGLINLIERGVQFANKEEETNYIKDFINYYKLADYGLSLKNVTYKEVKDLRQVEGIEMKIYNGNNEISYEDKQPNAVLMSINILKL